MRENTSKSNLFCSFHKFGYPQTSEWSQYEALNLSDPYELSVPFFKHVFTNKPLWCPNDFLHHLRECYKKPGHPAKTPIFRRCHALVSTNSTLWGILNWGNCLFKMRFNKIFSVCCMKATCGLEVYCSILLKKNLNNLLYILSICVKGFYVQVASFLCSCFPLSPPQYKRHSG